MLLIGQPLLEKQGAKASCFISEFRVPDYTLVALIINSMCKGYSTVLGTHRAHMGFNKWY